MKSTLVSMYFVSDEDIICDLKQETKGNKFLVNLIDTFFHVDYLAKIPATLRVIDGALVVVDCIEGVGLQTQTLMRQALMERVRPVLFVNKVDRALLELELDPEALYASFQRTIEAVNDSISTYHDEVLGNCKMSPDLGNVAFGSALHGWAFTLHQFAVRYSKKLGINREKMMERLWGDNFYNESTKRWTSSPVADDGTPNQRGFCKFVLDPIYKLFETIRNDEVDKYKSMIASLNIKLSAEDMELRGKDLLKKVMRHFLPAADALLEMCVIHLPSPVTAQQYRAETLYEGPIDDECAVAIRNCDPEGPLMVYVSNMVPTTDKCRFFALGRVFSGTVQAGQKVRIQGPNYEPGKVECMIEINIERLVLMMERYVEPIENCPVGNIIGLVGVDKFHFKSGTITTSENAHNMKVLKFSVSPVVRVAVDVKNPNDLPKLVEGLKRLSKSDPCVQCYTAKTGEHIVAGASEVHLEICLKDLEENRACVPLVRSDPVVQYCETIRETSSQTALSKSANGHNRIFMTAQPMDEEVTLDIEQGRGIPRDDIKACARYLSEKGCLNITEAHRIWCFGPNSSGPNVLVDATKAVESLDDTGNSIVSGFQQATAEGVLCGEPMRGCRFNIMDMNLHADAIHRSDDEVASAARNAIHAAQLLCEPALLEPVFLVEIQCTDRAVGSVHDVLSRRGKVIFKAQRAGTSMFTIKAHMPVSESFGLAADLCSHTAGQAFPQCIFDHWQLVPGSPLDPTSKAGMIVTAIRKRKGLSAEVPRLEDILNCD